MPTIACINATSRTLTYLISQSLTSSDGVHVKAIVRSEKRFLSKLPPTLLSNGKPPSNLTVHEYTVNDDTSILSSILQEVEIIYIALGINDNKPTTLNQDVVQSVVSALSSTKPANKRSPTKVVLLSAFPVTPHNLSLLELGEMSFPEQILHKKLLNHQYQDLTRAQSFLEKQSPWLNWTILTPGMIINDESPEELDAKVATFDLAVQDSKSGGTEPHDPISYARLARAMLAAASDEQYVRQYVAPIGTGRKPKMGWQAMQTQREVMGNYLGTVVIPGLVKWTTFGMVCAAGGYLWARPGLIQALVARIR